MPDLETAELMLRYVNWWTCVIATLLGLILGMYFLCRRTGVSRRRCSATIDLMWTGISGMSIVAALIVVGDLAWKSYQDQQSVQWRAVWDKLTLLDAAKLVSLNCPSGKAIAEPQLHLATGLQPGDSPCVRASTVLHWRTQVDRHIPAISNACPQRDLQIATRDYNGISDRSLVASCAGTTSCLLARCEQERATDQLLNAIESTGSEKLAADPTLLTYRASAKQAAATPMYDVYASTHLVQATSSFFILIPFWSLFFGARMSRAIAELCDPTGKASLCSFRRSVRSGDAKLTGASLTAPTLDANVFADPRPSCIAPQEEVHTLKPTVLSDDPLTPQA